MKIGKTVIGLFALAVSGMVWAAPQKPAAARAATQEIKSAGFSYTVGPVPAFVERLPEVRSGRAGAARSEGGKRIELLDIQTSLLEGEPREYLRAAVRVLDSQALQNASQVYVSFNPEYEKLTLHGIRLIRGGRVLDKTKEVRLDLLRREERLEQQMYEGVVTAVGVISDVRVDDLVEYEYTVSGSNPIFGNRYAAQFVLSQPHPVGEYRVRLLYPQSRQLNIRVPAGLREQKTLAGSEVRHVFSASEIPAVLDENDRPRWHLLRRHLEISEYQDWGDVRLWAERLFEVRGELAPELRERIASWKASGLPQEKLVPEVLRWVQENIRYFGIEIGINSHLPVHPNVALQRRYGDCKDKSLLLATLLGQLGIEAYPALVSVGYNRAIEQFIPRPNAFDHAIVQARVNGKSYWLDATLPPQYGTLDSIGANDYGSALVLNGQDSALTPAAYPPGYQTAMSVKQHYVVNAFSEPVELNTELVYRGTDAESMRMFRSRVSKEDFERLARVDVQRLHPTAEAVGDLLVEDDRENNTYTLRERYRIPEMFAYAPGKFSFESASLHLLDALRLPQAARRNTPLALQYPYEMRHVVIVELPDNPLRNAPAPILEKGRYWHYRSGYQLDSRRVQREETLTVLRDHVPQSALPEYIEETRKLREKTGFSFSLRVAELPKPALDGLLRSLRDYDAYGRTNSGGLKAEIEALVNIHQIEADIASGKLTRKQLAKAHEARAIAWDDQNNREAAIRDIDRALELDPDNVAYRFSKARILAGYGLHQQAVEGFSGASAEQWETLAKEHDYMVYGMSLYYLGRYRDAREQFEKGSVLGGDGRLFGALWQHLAALRGSEAGKSQLSAALGREFDTGWHGKIGGMLIGKLSPDDLLDAASSDDKGLERDRLCEAYFYIGQKLLLENNPDKARDYFTRAVDTKVFPYVEYKLGVEELKRLGGRKAGWLF